MQRGRHVKAVAGPFVLRRSVARQAFHALLWMLSPSFFAGCGNSSHPVKTDPGWRAALDRMQGAEAIFSLSYAAEPPEGTQLRIALHETDTESACALYASVDGANALDFWYLAVTLSHTSPGDYVVVPEVTATGPGQASVRLVHAVDGKKSEKYAATQGSVRLQQAPVDTAEWKAGTGLMGTIEVQFPSAPSTHVECRGNMSLQTGETFTECTCTDGSGKLSTCNSPDGLDCCRGSGPPVELSVAIGAEQCGFMCVASDSSLYRYCVEGQ